MQRIDWLQSFASTASNPWFLVIVAVWAAFFLFSLWDCLTRLKEPQRLTWVVVILALPLFGVLFYWFRGSDEGTKANRDLM